jgi:hypothetical protein
VQRLDHFLGEAPEVGAVGEGQEQLAAARLPDGESRVPRVAVAQFDYFFLQLGASADEANPFAEELMRLILLSFTGYGMYAGSTRGRGHTIP